MCAFCRVMSGVCVESRGSRRTSTSDKASVRKLYACRIVSCLASVVSVAGRGENLLPTRLQ